jgi:hypothetical protein
MTIQTLWTTYADKGPIWCLLKDTVYLKARREGGNFSLSLNQSSVSTEGGSVSFVDYNGVRRADSHASLAADTGLGKFYKRSLYGSIAAPLRKADCISLRDLFTSTNAQTA